MRFRMGEKLAISKEQELLEEYVRQLTQHELTLFVNISFRKFVHHEYAIKRFKRFFKYLNTDSEMLFSNYIRCWVFFEKHKTDRGGIHIHALVDRINPKHASIIQAKARRLFGEWSVVEPYDSSRGAAYYLAKKIIVDKTLEYEFYVINSKVRGRL